MFFEHHSKVSKFFPFSLIRMWRIHASDSQKSSELMQNYKWPMCCQTYCLSPFNLLRKMSQTHLILSFRMGSWFSMCSFWLFPAFVTVCSLRTWVSITTDSILHGISRVACTLALMCPYFLLKMLCCVILEGSYVLFLWSCYTKDSVLLWSAGWYLSLF